MRMLGSTAAAMQRMAFNAFVAAGNPSSNAATNFTLMLFTGTQPTKAEMNTYLNGTQHAAGNAVYQRVTAMLTARNADYVGGIAGAKPLVSTNANNFPILSAAAMNTKLVATNNDNRNCFMLKDASPTWFALMAGANSAINMQTGLDNGFLCSMLVIGSVGSENSGADLKIAGGKVFANNSTPNDQSRAVIVSDLVLKFA